ncbi:Syntaxin-32 [Camellia lanceoleosa]|nr:Syntaxin-32 [Camellia lanceoleosa]
MPVKSSQSSYRDRTQEFLNVAEKLRKSFSSSAPHAPTSSTSSTTIGSKDEAPRSALSIQSEFSKRASKIGFGIHQTSQKLAKLAKRSRQMENLSHCCNNSNINSNSRWFLYKTVICRAELKLSTMWNQLFTSWATSSLNWQPWFLSKESLQSGLMKTWMIH